MGCIASGSARFALWESCAQFKLLICCCYCFLLLLAAEQRLREVRRKHTGAKADLERLQKEKEKLQVQQAYLGDKWLGLADTCVEAREPQYTYRGCIFEKAAQVDNGAGHETNLGRWKGFSPDMTKVRRVGFCISTGWVHLCMFLYAGY